MDDQTDFLTALDAERADFPMRFGGGMVPFDTAYFAFMREHPDQPEAHALGVGVAAILDDFVARVKHRVAGVPLPDGTLVDADIPGVQAVTRAGGGSIITRARQRNRKP